uniref:Reverse transcriptase/retrotransposon-derived protein RNase H-like domain-containing protein n=1 Tax=Oryzias sinensis TaxID=183150 RepID=A0A8C7WKA4_9TELE
MEQYVNHDLHAEKINGKEMTFPVNWTKEADTAFCDIKQVLVSSTAIALPDYSKPFGQMVDCKGHFMNSVLVQQHGDKMKPVAYFSSNLDSVACALPHCVRAVIVASITDNMCCSYVIRDDLPNVILLMS